MGNPESDGAIGGRLGTEIAQNVEIGGSALYGFSGEETVTRTIRGRESIQTVSMTEDVGDDWYWGLHGVYHFTPNFYAGGHAPIGNGTWDIGNDIQPIGGVKILPLFVEYQHESLNGEDDKILFGAIFRF
jgi:hypothetical protein